MDKDDTNLRRLQAKFVLGAAAIAPISPFLFMQGSITRWKVGVLPAAAGPLTGIAGEGDDPARLYVIGESTVAGLGARTHELALAGRFAKHLSDHIKRPVEWDVLGKNGVTARRTIDELVPHMPDKQFDYILLGIGGNDVMRLSSPRRWREDMTELIGIMRLKHPDAVIFISNCPMIKYTHAIPPPSKQLLWQLSQMHDANIKEFTRDMERVFYYPQPVEVRLDGFFADGIHPSEQGYNDWSAAMIKFFTENYEW
ncbi:MAG TPA: SGNH/GDSL hydrolase family protein [Pyrinomonadaceae bacterium]|nr:SGNH/GDSL hydrolase family protein [Pyrinomonadaceae bacterium]